VKASSVIVAAGIVAIGALVVSQNSAEPGEGAAGAASGSPQSPAPATSNPLVSALANAIAKAEGYFSSATAVPVRANNPGDLVLGDVGNGVANSAGVTIFDSLEDGWNALFNEINAILSGTSKYISPDMTIAQMGQVYAGPAGGAAWAANVAGALGVSVDTPISSLSI
jgi:hypothetical protein